MQTSHIHAAFKSSRPRCLSVCSFSLSVALVTDASVVLSCTLCHVEMIEGGFSWCNSLIGKLILEAQISMDFRVTLESRNGT